MKKRIIAALLTFVMIFSLTVMDIPQVQAATYQGATIYKGHTYCLFPTQMSWSEAKAYCENIGGHLATITSEDEQAFLEQLNSSSKKVWIGGYRDDYFVWHWITDEDLTYTNWDDGEPNNEGNETCMSMWPEKWNDLGDDSSEQSGLICEWDYELEEADSFQSVIDGYKAQATVFNGHSYYVVENRTSWTDANKFANLVGGHLVTITSSQEQLFLEYLTGGKKNLWIGAYRDDYFIWHWVTGEKWSYTNWGDGEPNNQGNESFGTIWPKKWNDLKDASYEQSGYIIEWDSATNSTHKYKKQKQTITGLVNVKKTYKYSKLKKKAYAIKLKGNAETKLTYKKTSGNKKIKVATNGKITVPKKLKKGTYVIKVKASTSGNKIYKKASKNVTVKIVVK